MAVLSDRGRCRGTGRHGVGRGGVVMDNNAIDGAMHEIAMMVLVLLHAVETLQGTETSPKVCQMPDEAGEMLSFAAFDIAERVKALRAALCPPRCAVLTIVRDQ